MIPGFGRTVRSLQLTQIHYGVIYHFSRFGNIYIYLRLPKTFTVFAGCQGGIDYNVLKLSEATFGKNLGKLGDYYHEKHNWHLGKMRPVTGISIIKLRIHEGHLCTESIWWGSRTWDVGWEKSLRKIHGFFFGQSPKIHGLSRVLHGFQQI